MLLYYSMKHQQVYGHNIQLGPDPISGNYPMLWPAASLYNKDKVCNAQLYLYYIYMQYVQTHPFVYADHGPYGVRC
jgi:hypothetical protein